MNFYLGYKDKHFFRKKMILNPLKDKDTHSIAVGILFILKAYDSKSIKLLST